MTKFEPVWNPETHAWVQPRYYLSASQSGVGTVIHFATLEQANDNFNERKTFDGFARGIWTEVTDGLPASILRKAVWTSVRKNGRPGTLRHILYIATLNGHASY